MKKFLKYLFLYLKHRDEINNYYGYALKEGYASNERASWLERTKFWWGSE